MEFQAIWKRHIVQNCKRNTFTAITGHMTTKGSTKSHMTRPGTRRCRSRLRQKLASSWLTSAIEDKVQLFILIFKGILQNKMTILFSTDSVFFSCEDYKENSFDSCKFPRENLCLIKLDSVRISRPWLNKKKTNPGIHYKYSSENLQGISSL